MGDNYPVPPPPPPSRASKPVPPPPPGRAPTPPAPSTAPLSNDTLMPPSGMKPVSGAVPAPRPGMPSLTPNLAGGPSMPPMGAPSGIEQRLQEMERRFQLEETSKKTLESQINDLQKQLKDEHEKVIIQSLKAKEEEALSSKVEQQLREMQDKLRREKYEQELHDSRGKAEIQLKELERRMADERETWMVALKNQLKERENVEHEVEQNLNHRIHEVERRYQDEKNVWSLSMRQKEEEIHQIHRQSQLDIEKLNGSLEEKDDKVEEVKDQAALDRRALEQQTQAEIRAMQVQVDTQLREAGSWKAQMALLQSQLHQAEVQHQEERVHWQSQTERLDQDHVEMRKRLETQMAGREEELKREFSRREQERAQYWEGVVSQMRAEKEALRNSLMRREEELAALQIDVSEMKREIEVEHSRWQTEAEKIRRAARDEAIRDLPEHLQKQLESEHKKWEQDHLSVIQELHGQLARSREAQIALNAKLDTDNKQAEQERTALQSQFNQERTQWENQTKGFLHRIADTQLKEAAVREEMEQKVKEWEAQRGLWALEHESTRTELLVLGQNLAAREEELKLQKDHTTVQKADLETARQTIQGLHQAQAQWEATESQMRETFNAVKAEMVQLQTDRSEHEAAWTEKEAQWVKEKAEMEIAKAAVAAPSAAAPAPASPEATKALTAIRQQMQEMQTLLTWLRPASKGTTKA